jgi:hypothetical protein
MVRLCGVWRDNRAMAIRPASFVVARRMQDHAVRRRACLFVADIGVAHETSMVIDGSPPVGAVPDEFATGFAASLDVLETPLFRGR